MTELKKMTEEEMYDHFMPLAEKIMKIFSEKNDELANEGCCVSDGVDIVLSALGSIFLSLIKTFELKFPDHYSAQQLTLEFYKNMQESLKQIKGRSIQ